MDFSLTTEQRDIQKAAEEFAKGEFDPDAAMEYDQNQQFPVAIWKKACELGFVGVFFPEAYGGAGLGLLENALIAEAFCRQDSGMGMAMALSDFGSEMILRQGNEHQKKRILPLISQGKKLMTMACLEEGYSLAPFKTTATINGDGYIIHGTKSFVPLGSLTDHMIVVCQMDSEDPFSQSVILVERETDGLETTGMGQKMGMRMIPMDQVSFNHVRVPKENIIGQEGEGNAQLRAFFDEMRVEAGAMGVGIAQGGLDMALEYSKKREAFGKAIVHFDVIRNKLADMYMDVEMARVITYKSAWSFDHGKRDTRLSLITKVIASKTAYNVTNHALQIHGGQGYMKEGRIEHFYRDAKVLGLFLESAQLQRNMLADEIAGKKGG